MFERVTKMFAKQEMTAQPQQQATAPVVTEQPAAQDMSADASKTSLRGGGEGADICCGLCAGFACFECCELCC